jgi:hypothetical protein
MPYCQTATGPWLSLAVYPGTGTTSDVHLAVNSSPGPCAVQAAPISHPAFPRAAELLPRLTPPPGVQLMQTGGSGTGGANRWSSEAAAETSRGAAELEAHFAQQLAAAGWTRQAGRADGPLAWSAWAVPEEGDWRGLLLVADWPTADRRWLSVRVESPSISSGDVGYITSFGSASAVPVPATGEPGRPPTPPPLPTLQPTPAVVPPPGP